MKKTIKVRTFLGQAIDTFKEYIKTKGNLQIDYSLEEYMQEILDYIDYLEQENQQLKEQLEEYKNENKRLGQDKLEYLNKFTKMLSSQDKFIKYLEDEIEKQKEDIFENSLTSKDIDLYIKRVKLVKIEEILQEYKEKIGEKNNEIRSWNVCKVDK